MKSLSISIIQDEELAKVKLNWKEGYLKRWLEDKKPSTTNVYKNDMRKYTKWSEQTPEQMLQEKLDDKEKPLIEQGAVEEKVKRFNKWLREEYISERKKKKALKEGREIPKFNHYSENR